jgi:6-phosphogluconate dehydrogenase
VLDKIRDDLREGDIILDGGNEHYRNTERRQRELEAKGVMWIGMGVSGGYQSARRGPSLSLGGDKEAVEFVLPMLERFAAKSPKDGKPCVQYMGKFS